MCIWSSPQTLSPQTPSLGEWLPFILAFGLLAHFQNWKNIRERQALTGDPPSHLRHTDAGQTEERAKWTHANVHAHVRACSKRHTHKRMHVGEHKSLQQIWCSKGIFLFSRAMVSPVLSGSLVVALSCFDPVKDNRLNLIKKSPPHSHFLVVFCFASQAWSQVLARESTSRCWERSQPRLFLSFSFSKASCHFAKTSHQSYDERKVGGSPNDKFLLVLLLVKYSHQKMLRLARPLGTRGIAYLFIVLKEQLHSHRLELLLKPAAGIFFPTWFICTAMPCFGKQLGFGAAETVSPAVDHFPTGLSLTPPQHTRTHRMFCLTESNRNHILVWISLYFYLLKCYIAGKLLFIYCIYW